ncbi:PepSY-associated TM helix domain-containing protein [Acidovorax sp.]|uniref:PepSY-associated TM helix domain-containing protein n=1 Tax=Acidovorax sp. TaxID=1872122 RepID=UPI00391F5EA8
MQQNASPSLPTPPTLQPATSESALYRRVWRWHFYAGLVCLPFLALLAITGALYLYKEPIESVLYAKLRAVDDTSGASLDAQALIANALKAQPGQHVRFNGPAVPGLSAEVGIRVPGGGTVGIYLDPVSGRVLGQLPDSQRLSEVVKGLHSLMIVGRWANYWVEIVAGWAIVLVVSGVFLWWPRGRKGGVYSLRGHSSQRLWWRDLHAFTGTVAAAAILFLAVTGMPWSAYWGQHFGRITSELGIGLPRYLFGPGPSSSVPLASVGTSVPWMLSQAPTPLSTPPAQDPSQHAGHASVQAPLDSEDQHASSIGVNRALQIFEGLGLPPGTPVSLPSGPQGTYAAMRFPDDVRDQRVVHLDRYSGKVLSDVGYRNYGPAGRAIEWGVNIHTGLQFGWINRLVMLAACVSIVVLTVSAVVMWWKRRPKGRLAAPPRRAADRAAVGSILVAAILGAIYPLLGASMLFALLVDAALPTRLREQFRL